MTDWVIDTNVPIIANGRGQNDEVRVPTIACRQASILFLQRLLEVETILVDLAGEIQSEYRNHLRPSGQPGVGDRFYQVILHSSPDRVRRVDLPKRLDGEFEDLPQSLIDTNFDPSDRKFVALANREGAQIANSTDSDWVHHEEIFRAEGIGVHHICGADRERWFAGNR